MPPTTRHSAQTGRTSPAASSPLRLAHRHRALGYETSNGDRIAVINRGLRV
ncbi:MAG: hypothetical protein OJI67_23840 [Prosthecobacter sp.]|nr:hypothetical protein [Prosthecobacter sp.]